MYFLIAFYQEYLIVSCLCVYVCIFLFAVLSVKVWGVCVCVHDGYLHIVAVEPSLCSNIFRSVSVTVVIAAISIVQHLTDNG